MPPPETDVARIAGAAPTPPMYRYGMPRRINDEIFIAMGKALDFLDPDRLSMTVVLTAMNRFINEVSR